jgi:hypothetical protein
MSCNNRRPAQSRSAGLGERLLQHAGDRRGLRPQLAADLGQAQAAGRLLEQRNELLQHAGRSFLAQAEESASLVDVFDN